LTSGKEFEVEARQNCLDFWASKTLSAPFFLLGYPLHVPLHGLVGLEFFQRVQPGGQGHFVVELVQASVAQAADHDAGLALLFGEVFLEAGSAMDLARDQVVKSQRHRSPA